MPPLLIGTNNPSKLAWIRHLLRETGARCVSPGELGLSDVEAEHSRTAEGNAIEKARAWHAASSLPVLTEDSGLVFLSLPEDHHDQPGVMVRRVHGHTMDDEEMLRWYQAIFRRHGGMLQAAWQDAWCLLKDGNTYETWTDSQEILTHRAITLVDAPCAVRTPGWPLDSLTYYPQLGKYRSELAKEEVEAVRYETDKAAEEEHRAMLRWLHGRIREYCK